MAGFHSLPADCDTSEAAANRSPSRVAAKILARPLRHPCHATHTLPFESVVATGPMSEPGSFEIWTIDPGTPPATLRAKISKLPRLFCAQNTHTRCLPSTATATPAISSPVAVMGRAGPQDPPAYFRRSTW